MAKFLSPIYRRLERSSPSLALALRARLQKLTGERELRLLTSLVDSDRLSVDIGANKGVYTYWLSRLSAGTISIEPHPDCIHYLRQAFGSRITLIEGACSDSEGTVTLRVPVDNGQQNVYRASIESKNNLNEAVTKKHTVKTFRLDNLNLSDIGFVKIDVEGHEMAVLHGAKQLLNDSKPALLVELEERHKAGTISQADQFLKDLGYDGYYLLQGKLLPMGKFDANRHQGKKADMSSTKGTEQFINNFIFIHKDHSSVRKALRNHL